MKRLGFIFLLMCKGCLLTAGVIPYPLERFSAECFFLEDSELYKQWAINPVRDIKHKQKFVEQDKFTLALMFANAAVAPNKKMDVEVSIRIYNPDESLGFEEGPVKISSDVVFKGHKQWYLSPMKLTIGLTDEKVGVYRLEVEFHEKLRNLRKLSIREFEVLPRNTDITKLADVYEVFRLEGEPPVFVYKKTRAVFLDDEPSTVDVSLKTKLIQ